MTVAPIAASADQQALADEIYRLMVGQGALFALDTPIRQSLANLSTFLAARHQQALAVMAEAIEHALAADVRFTREQVGDEVRFITSRNGTYEPRSTVDTHSFKKRLYEPEHPLPIDDISVVVSTSRPAITTVEPVFISDYWQVQASMVLAPHVEVAPTLIEAPTPEEPVTLTPELVIEQQPPAVEVAPELVLAEVPAVVVAAAEVPTVLAETPVVVPVAPTPVAPTPLEATPVVSVAPPLPVEPVAAPLPVVPTQPVTPPPPVMPPPARPVTRPAFERSTIFTLADGTAIDLRRPVAEIIAEHGALLADLLAQRIEHDPLRRIVSFGPRYYPEAGMTNLGKNDLRKLRDYILERGEPLLDSELIADVFYHNSRQADYEGWRFSLNYRLHREKDFEFVGVEGASLWSTKGLPTIGGKRVKAAEMGQITAYLVEGLDDSLELQSAEAIQQGGSLTRMLTFFEWEHGVLPFDASLRALLPGPVLPDQRSAVLRFESPQHYTQALVEVRYPTGNRGGWLQGLEEFFHEHLVPGAMVTLTRTAEPHVFTIVYEEAQPVTDRILTFDEKKNKFAFANRTYYAAADAEQLTSQTRYARLNRLKSFPMGERRKAEIILAHVAETIGEQGGDRAAPHYRVTFDDLVIAFNVLRPGSRTLLSQMIERSDEFESDPARPDAFLYTPPAGTESAEEEEEDEEGTDDLRGGMQPTRRRYGGRYGDDDE